MRARVVVSTILILVPFLSTSTLVRAQCSNLTGSPAPVTEPLLASKAFLVRGGGGVWGDGNDKLKILKGLFGTSAPIDPVGTQDVHMTLRKNGIAGPVVFQATLPAGVSWTSAPSGRLIYSDGSATHGVRKIVIDPAGPNFYELKKILGKSGSFSNLPLAPGDTLHMMLEMEAGGAGECVDYDFVSCATPASGSKHVCF